MPSMASEIERQLKPSKDMGRWCFAVVSCVAFSICGVYWLVFPDEWNNNILLVLFPVWTLMLAIGARLYWVERRLKRLAQHT